MKRLIYIAVLFLFVISCKQNKNIVKSAKVRNNPTVSAANQQTIVYKTTKDFSDYVPVIMNSERTEIISYPAPSDLSATSKPTKLKNDYWLDNRGITENVVFLNYSYESYSKLTEAPSLIEMKRNVKEKYPLKELIFCGSRYQFKDEVKELNVLINAGFPGCKKADIVSMSTTLD